MYQVISPLILPKNALFYPGYQFSLPIHQRNKTSGRKNPVSARREKVSQENTHELVLF